MKDDHGILHLGSCYGSHVGHMSCVFTRNFDSGSFGGPGGFCDLLCCHAKGRSPSTSMLRCQEPLLSFGPKRGLRNSREDLKTTGYAPLPLPLSSPSSRCPKMPSSFSGSSCTFVEFFCHLGFYRLPAFHELPLTLGKPCTCPESSWTGTGTSVARTVSICRTQNDGPEGLLLSNTEHSAFLWRDS